MSRATARTASFIATIWPAGTVGQFGGEQPGIPYTVKCSYLEGGNRTATNSSGVKFQPKLMVWYELTTDQPRPDPEKQCYVAIGDFMSVSSPTEAGAYPIKSNSLQPWINSTQKPDVELAC